MYTFYIGINDVPLLVVDFGYFFSSWGWGGVPKFPKVSLFLYIFCSVSVLNLIKSCEKYSVWLLLISLINVLQSSPPMGILQPPRGSYGTPTEKDWIHTDCSYIHMLIIWIFSTTFWAKEYNSWSGKKPLMTHGQGSDPWCENDPGSLWPTIWHTHHTHHTTVTLPTLNTVTLCL